MATLPRSTWCGKQHLSWCGFRTPIRRYMVRIPHSQEVVAAERSQTTQPGVSLDTESRQR